MAAQMRKLMNVMFRRNRRDPNAWNPDTEKLSFIQTVPWSPSRTELCMLRRSWSQDPDFLNTFGLDVFAFVFDQHPASMKLFKMIRKRPRQWRDNEQFQQHARKFTEVFVYVLRNLERMPEVEYFLHELGFQHARLSNKNFRIAYWELFKDGILKTMKTHVEQTEDSTGAPLFSAEEQKMVMVLWNHLTEFVVQKMFYGFSEGVITERRKIEQEVRDAPNLFKKSERRLRLDLAQTGDGSGTHKLSTGSINTNTFPATRSPKLKHKHSTGSAHASCSE